ncbi:hypothetical protein PFLUV_G00000050 [Perca fluviatilis]|uniref:Uncharacterized protein n=1 Tax=Perca fluviatilis TaxID=8168 RepID=A0A6A5FFW4_PERFL|nr:hypothetical protein PFLUV_G00000050 [Perca fluviatilis]
MGLRHNAIHAMLANPHLAPFELIDRPCLPQDWTLIDHLMVIHKVKESDYIEDDPQGSILSMARTLALCYVSENEGSQCVVLVKDGTRAQKPAQKAAPSYPPSVDDDGADDGGDFCDGDEDGDGDFGGLRGINMAALEGAWCPRHI